MTVEFTFFVWGEQRISSVVKKGQIERLDYTMTRGMALKNLVEH